MESLYFLDVRNASFDERFLASLSGEERLKADRYIQEHDKALCLGKYYLLHRYLGDKMILYTAYGKPYIEGGPYISITHCYPYVMLFVADSPCGVDLEMPRDDREAFLERYFDPTEKDFGLSLLQRWTLKESAYKCIGEGAFNPKQQIEELSEETLIFKGRQLFYRLYDFDGGTLAITSPKMFDVTLIEAGFAG